MQASTGGLLSRNCMQGAHAAVVHASCLVLNNISILEKLCSLRSSEEALFPQDAVSKPLASCLADLSGKKVRALYGPLPGCLTGLIVVCGAGQRVKLEREIRWGLGRRSQDARWSLLIWFLLLLLQSSAFSSCCCQGASCVCVLCTLFFKIMFDMCIKVLNI